MMPKKVFLYVSSFNSHFTRYVFYFTGKEAKMPDVQLHMECRESWVRVAFMHPQKEADPGPNSVSPRPTSPPSQGRLTTHFPPPALCALGQGGLFHQPEREEHSIGRWSCRGFPTQDGVGGLISGHAPYSLHPRPQASAPFSECAQLLPTTGPFPGGCLVWKVLAFTGLLVESLPLRKLKALYMPLTSSVWCTTLLST